MHDSGSMYREPARDVPVMGQYDVVVCGGGPAGCAAAIAAARRGARTLLLEREGYLGGATVSQLVAVILSTNGADFQGIWHEYIAALKRLDGVGEMVFSPGQIRSCVDPEMVKFAWDQLIAAAGVQLLHHVYAATAIVRDGAACGVAAETRAGRRVVLARRVIDATGDGIVAAEAGVPWQQGDGRHPYAMALTKVFRLGNVPDMPPASPDELSQAAAQLQAAIERGEFDSPVITNPQRLLAYFRYRLWRLTPQRREVLSVLSRVLKIDPLDPWQLTAAEREGRCQALQAARAYRTCMPGFEQAYLLDTSSQIGIRSSRRLAGLATVTTADATEFRKHPDGIARSSWDIDVWPADSYTAPAVDRGASAYKARHERLLAGDYFDIRYGCIVAAGIDNLLMAGRCISAEHVAESSLRIQQTCMATGQAAGVAAAMSIEHQCTPRQLDAAALVAQLARDRAVEPAFAKLSSLPLVGGELV